MARGRRWSEEENNIIRKMYGEGYSVEEIAKRLPADRSVGAVQRHIGRLRLKRHGIVRTIEKNIVPTIEVEAVMSREDALKLLSAAIKYLHKDGELKNVEIKRLRSITTMVRSYFAVYDSYERYAELEKRMEELEAFIHQEAEKNHIEA